MLSLEIVAASACRNDVVPGVVAQCGQLADFVALARRWRGGGERCEPPVHAAQCEAVAAVRLLLSARCGLRHC